MLAHPDCLESSGSLGLIDIGWIKHLDYLQSSVYTCRIKHFWMVSRCLLGPASLQDDFTGLVSISVGWIKHRVKMVNMYWLDQASSLTDFTSYLSICVCGIKHVDRSFSRYLLGLTFLMFPFTTNL